MKTTTKKGAKKSKAKPRATSASASIAALKKTIAAQAREIRQGAEQQAATSEILRVIARWLIPSMSWTQSPKTRLGCVALNETSPWPKTSLTPELGAPTLPTVFLVDNQIKGNTSYVRTR